eukprot:CAMPEP_0198141272 /NCGR_PEP_ID=MMETSP1443-20131203/4310_1 /TAXON_ID=186043 /ORGANISM="Entomoneis sp., Strain CCMP2396" /LENGTH=537 /DNA_ID=CAMNT_0043803975 /DNA_START=8 /DNA_END=1621 /DNA_ORIENTATION=-
MGSSTIQDPYGYCKELEGEDASTDEILRCVTNILARDAGSLQYSRTVLVVFSASLVFFMQAGFAMVCAGAVRKKNVQNTMLKNLLDACGAAIAFFTVGYAFAYGGSKPESSEKTFIGTQNFFLLDEEDYAFFLFQYAFSAASATIVAGTLAERCQMAAYLCYSIMLTGWVYPVIAHSIWSPNGFLSAHSIDPLWGVGMIDFAGSGVVHVTGGTTALFATVILGPRRGRFHDDTGRRLETPREFPGHSMALQMLGTFILWFGWYGFNCGSALLSDNIYGSDVAALAGVNTTLAAGSAGIVALFLNLFALERYTGEPYFDLKYAMNGVLCGLVSVTAGCGVLEPWAAVVIGSIAGVLYILGTRGLVALRLDDAVDAIPVHMVNGIWGTLAVGFFASPRQLLKVYGRDDHPGLFYTWRDGNSDALLLGTQCVGILFILGWVFVIMFPFFIWLDWKGWFRSDALEEIVGLDTSYHGGLALMSDGDEINPEYISAYRQKKQEKQDGLRRRKGGPQSDTTRETGGFEEDHDVDHDVDEEQNDP